MAGGVAEEGVRLTRAETAALLFWLLKDAGWVILLTPLACIGAALALPAQILVVAADWGRGPGLRIHSFAELLWLIGNIVWMLGEQLWDSGRAPGHKMPWHTGPLLVDNPEAYAVCNKMAGALFVSGLMILVGFYIACATGAYRWDGLPTGAAEHPKEHLVFGLFAPELYARMFIGPWILKDALWTTNLAMTTVAATMVCLAMALDNLRRFGGSAFLAELLWFLGTLVWLFAEVLFDDRYRLMRFLSCGLLLTGGACAVRGIVLGGMLKDDEDIEEDKGSPRRIEERLPLKAP